MASSCRSAVLVDEMMEPRCSASQPSRSRESSTTAVITAGLAGFVLNLLRLIKGRFGEDAHKFRVIGCNREPHRFAAGIVEADFGRIVFQVEIFRTFKSILHQFGRIQAIERYVLKVAGIGLVDEVVSSVVVVSSITKGISYFIAYCSA